MTLSKEKLEKIAELARKENYKPCTMHMTNLIAVCDSEVIEEMARSLLAAEAQEPVYQYRIRNWYNGQVTEWKTIRRDQVDFVLKEQPNNAEFQIIAAPQPAAVQKPVRYLNKFSGVCVTLEQQPDAATDVGVYQPLYTEAPAVLVTDALLSSERDFDRYRAIVERCCEILHGSVTDVDLLTVTVQSVKDRLRAMETSELLSAMEEVLRISDRQHDAWDRVRAGIAAWKRA